MRFMDIEVEELEKGSSLADQLPNSNTKCVLCTDPWRTISEVSQ